MGQTNGVKPSSADAKLPKVVVRRSRAKPVRVVTPKMKEQLRANARVSRRRTLPELPEWQRAKSD